MQKGLHIEGKNLYQSPQFSSALTNLVGLVKNTLRFVEVVKVIFQQKGYISAGLKANVSLKKAKIAFGS